MDYSVGLFQINYYGNLLPGRTKEYGSPQLLQSSPQAQANAAYQLAGGNELVGLQNWALTSSPANGEVPLGSTASVGQNTLKPYIPAAMAAASEVGTFGPAAASQIAQGSTWPGASPLGSALAGGGANYGPAANLASDTTATSGCDGKVGGNPGAPHNLFTIPHTSAGLTFCQAKAMLGGLSMAAGGFLVVVGLITLVTGGKGGGIAGKVVAMAGPVGKVASGVGSVAGAPRRQYQRNKAADAEQEAA
jgi:hypothetical protein